MPHDHHSHAPSADNASARRDRYHIGHTTLQLEGLGECAAVDCALVGKRRRGGLRAVR